MISEKEIPYVHFRMRKKYIMSNSPLPPEKLDFLSYQVESPKNILHTHNMADFSYFGRFFLLSVAPKVRVRKIHIKKNGVKLDPPKISSSFSPTHTD